MSTAEKIRPIIESTYGKGPLAQELIEYLEKQIDNFTPRYEDDSREDMVMQTCWTWMTGGTTAEAVAKEIEAALSPDCDQCNDRHEVESIFVGIMQPCGCQA